MFKTWTEYYNQSRPYALCIIDPNNKDNDISGGSHNVLYIFKCFSEAFELLQSRMNEIRVSTDPAIRSDSILSIIFGGTYESFTKQREKLRAIAGGQ